MVNLNWQSAEVRDGALTVELEGEIEDGWTESFENTVKLLGEHEWQKAQLKQGAVIVGDIPPGSEGKLRHYLESVVEQANAALAAREEDAGSSSEDADQSVEGADAEMQERFRTFASGAENEDG